MPNILKDFLHIETNSKEITLGVKDKENIKKLVDIAPQRRFVLFFDAMPVEEIYDGYEFKSVEEEFYYYNSKSYIVFEDITNFKVRIGIKTIEKIKDCMTFKDITNAVKIAVEYTKEHPEVSRNKVY